VCYDWTWPIGEDETGILALKWGLRDGVMAFWFCALSFLVFFSCRFERKTVMGMRGNGGKWF